MFKSRRSVPFQSPAIQELKQHAVLIRKSKIAEGRSVEKNMVIIEHGKTYNLSPLESVINIQIKKGKLCVKPEFVMGLINRTGQLASLVIEDDGQQCKVTMIRQGQTAFTAIFSKNEVAALAANLGEEYQDAEIIRQWGAILKCATFLFPEIMMNFSASFFRKESPSKWTVFKVVAANLLNKVRVSIKSFLEKKRLLASQN